MDFTANAESTISDSASRILDSTPPSLVTYHEGERILIFENSSRVLVTNRTPELCYLVEDRNGNLIQYEPRPHYFNSLRLNKIGSKVVAYVDAVDPDNFGAVLAASKTSSGLCLKGVVVGARNVYDPSDHRDVLYQSNLRTYQNAKRMKGFLARAGITNVPVFVGEYTCDMLPPIPHNQHIDELLLDQYHDVESTSYEPDGDEKSIDRLLQNGIGERTDLIVGGPLTDVALLQERMRTNGYEHRLGIMATQLSSTYPSVERSFNATSNISAALTVLKNWPEQITVLPRNLTRNPMATFSLDELREMGINHELLDLYEGYIGLTDRNPNEIFLHDLFPVIAMMPAVADKVLSTVSLKTFESGVYSSNHKGSQDTVDPDWQISNRVTRKRKLVIDADHNAIRELMPTLLS